MYNHVTCPTPFTFSLALCMCLQLSYLNHPDHSILDVRLSLRSLPQAPPPYAWLKLS